MLHLYDEMQERGVVYSGVAVPDKETAAAVATAVFNGMSKSETSTKFTLQATEYDSERNVWMVSFWDKDNGVDVDGEDCTVEIKKLDGKVVGIWFGE